MAIKASNFDHPIVFLLAMFMGIVALFALSRWLFKSLGWTGPLGLVTMGCSGHGGAANSTGVATAPATIGSTGRISP